MKVTCKFDEAAALTPAEVKVRQIEAEAKRLYAAKWADNSRVVVVSSGFGGLNIGALLDGVKGGTR